MSYLPTGPGDSGSFTVVMTELLRDRFERWLKREHLMMHPTHSAGGEGPLVYLVTPQIAEHR